MRLTLYGLFFSSFDMISVPVYYPLTIQSTWSLLEFRMRCLNPGINMLCLTAKLSSDAVL